MRCPAGMGAACLNRLSEPKTHAGASARRELTCLPTEALGAYAAGPGVAPVPFEA